jgi:hypothetical protein
MISEVVCSREMHPKNSGNGPMRVISIKKYLEKK